MFMLRKRMEERVKRNVASQSRCHIPLLKSYLLDNSPRFHLLSLCSHWCSSHTWKRHSWYFHRFGRCTGDCNPQKCRTHWTAEKSSVSSLPIQLHDDQKGSNKSTAKYKTFTILSCVSLKWRVFINLYRYSRCNNYYPAYNHIPLPWYNDPHPTKGQHHIYSPQRKCSVVILSFQIWSKLQQCRERTLCRSYLMGIVELRDKKRKPWS